MPGDGARLVMDPVSGELAHGLYLRCPLDGCDWLMRCTTPEQARPLVFGQFATIDAMVAAIAAAAAGRDDAEALRHLQDAHTIAEFVATIVRLQRELAEPRNKPDGELSEDEAYDLANHYGDVALGLRRIRRARSAAADAG